MLGFSESNRKRRYKQNLLSNGKTIQKCTSIPVRQRSKNTRFFSIHGYMVGNRVQKNKSNLGSRKERWDHSLSVLPSFTNLTRHRRVVRLSGSQIIFGRIHENIHTIIEQSVTSTKPLMCVGCGRTPLTGRFASV